MGAVGGGLSCADRCRRSVLVAGPRGLRLHGNGKVMTRAPARTFFRSSPPQGRRWLLAFALVLLAQGSCAGSALGDIAPTVSSVTPAQGSVAGGEQITINGSGFVGSNGSCSGA